MFHRIASIWRRANQTLAQHPILFLLCLLAFKVIEDRVMNWANRQIDQAANGFSLSLTIARIVKWLDSTPGGLVIAIAILVLIAIGIHAYLDTRHSRRERSDLRVLNKTDDATVEFSPTRDVGVQLSELLNDSQIDVFWIMTHSGTNLRAINRYKITNSQGKKTIQRLILLSPTGNALDAFAAVEKDREKNSLVTEITETAKIIKEQASDIELKYLDAPFNATIIGNPAFGDYGWIQIELFYPWSETEKRSRICIDKQKQPERFKEIADAYDKVWRDIATNVPVAGRESKPPRDTSSLVIHLAYYGAKGEYLDATEAVRKEISGDKLDVLVSNNLVPKDPIFGTVKLLVVSYSTGDLRIRQIARKEGERLLIPEPIVGSGTKTDAQVFYPDPVIIADVEAANTEIESWKKHAHQAEYNEHQRKLEIQVLKNELETKDNQLKDLNSSFTAFKHRDGKWRINECGNGREPLGLSVAVQFVDHHDSDLAKQIRGFFSNEIPGWSPWKTQPVEHIRWRENPSSKARIVIFSDHDDSSGGIKTAINDCELLSEKVDRFDRKPDMLGDITIIIFDKVGKEEW